MASSNPIKFWHPSYHDDFENIFKVISEPDSKLCIDTILRILNMTTGLNDVEILFCNMSFVRYMQDSKHRLAMTTDISDLTLHIKLESH